MDGISRPGIFQGEESKSFQGDLWKAILHTFLREKNWYRKNTAILLFAGEDFGDLAFVEWNLDCRSVHAGRLRTEGLRGASNCKTSSWRCRMQSVEERLADAKALSSYFGEGILVALKLNCVSELVLETAYLTITVELVEQMTR